MTLIEDNTLRWHCSRCGSERIERLAWVRLNGETVVNHGQKQDYWCPRCEQHFDSACQVNRNGHCVQHDRPRGACRSEVGSRSEELRLVACGR